MPRKTVATLNSTPLEQIIECQATGNGTYFISTLLRVAITRYNSIVVVTIVVGQETLKLLPVLLLE
jgi:hypothetical protein